MVTAEARPTRFPFAPYPNGWYRIAWSDELAVATTKALRWLGRELVAFRGADGAARVLDAHCPHLGAHLGHGGVVDGSCLRCPFHGWTFDGTGRCVSIPYADKIVRQARVQAWPVAEVNGAIFFYYDAERRAPPYPIPALRDGRPIGAGRRRGWQIRTHIQEITENAVDSAHFNLVHRYEDVPVMTALDFDGPRFRVSFESQKRVFGVLSKTDFTIHYHGPGVAFARVNHPVEIDLLVTLTPIDHERCEQWIVVDGDLRYGQLRRLLCRSLIADQVFADFRHDIPIWEHKVYLEKPLLCADDGPIHRVRHWYRQFYA